MKKTTSALKKKATSKIDLAAPVSQRVELDNIQLVETVARRKPLRGKLPAKVSLSVSVQTDADKKQGAIHVRPRFILVAPFDDAPNDGLLRIEALFLLQYRLPSFEGLRKANIDAFGEMNGLYNGWPFWREFVQAMSSRMGFPALTIPVRRPGSAEVSGKKDSSRSAPALTRAKKKRTRAAGPAGQ